MKKKLKYDMILICGVLLAAGIIFFLFHPSDTGAWAVVTTGGEETARYPLNQNFTVTLGDGDYNILQISNGAASITEANCGDHTCIHTGAISREGEMIVCLPHHLTIRIEGGVKADVDAVAQ